MTGASLVELPAALSAQQPRARARYVMGVDGGATKTLAAVLDLHAAKGADGPALHLGHGGPSNQDAVGAQAAVRELLRAADEALERAGVEARELGAAVLAIAGTDTEDVARNLRSARTDAWLVVNDVVAAWASATGGGPGVAAIAGTGSNVFGVGVGVGDGRRTGRGGDRGHGLERVRGRRRRRRRRRRRWRGR